MFKDGVAVFPFGFPQKIHDGLRKLAAWIDASLLVGNHGQAHLFKLLAEPFGRGLPQQLPRKFGMVVPLRVDMFVEDVGFAPAGRAQLGVHTAAPLENIYRTVGMF